MWRLPKENCTVWWLSGSHTHVVPLCLSLQQPFEASDLLLGLNFSKVLSSLVALNKVTAGESDYLQCVSQRLPATGLCLLPLSADTESSIFICCCLLCPDIGVGSDSVCARHSSAHRIKSFESLSCQASLGRSSKLLQNQFRSLVMSTLTTSFEEKLECGKHKHLL